MPFVRVRSANPADPQHIFDVSVEESEINSDLYVIVDPEPSDMSRPAEIVEVAAPRPARAVRKAPAKKTSRRATRPAAPVPPDPEGDQSLDSTQKENG